MLKQLSICAALIAFATGSVNAQQREAALQRVVLAGSEFDLAVVSVKPGAQILDMRKEIDPLLVHVAGGELAVSYDQGTQNVFPQIEAMLSPICVGGGNGKVDKSRMPIAIYLVPKAD